MVHKSSGLASGGGSGGGVTTLQGLTGGLTLTSTGNTITITPSGSTIDLESVSGGAGTVTSVSGVTANGFAFSITNPTVNPAITAQTTVTGVLQGNGTAISAVSNGGISNALLANSAVTIGAQTGLSGGGSVALGSAITLSMGTGAANTLAGYNSSGVFSDVSIGSNLSLVGGVLNGTGGGGGREISFSLDGQGSAISAISGSNTWYLANTPFAGTITSWSLVGDVSGSINIDVWKANAAVPTVSNTITASAQCSLASTQSMFNGPITGWSSAVSKGDCWGFHINSASTITKANLAINVTAL